MSIYKKISIYIIFIFLTALVIPSVTSCRDSASFESITICETINQETLEPGKTNDSFEITAKTIYTVVKYNDAKRNASYHFTWTNLDTGEKKITEKYTFPEKNDPKAGHVVSVFSIKDSKSIMTPGKYEVEFYYNDTQKLKTGFEVKEPVTKIISVEMADSINKNYSPANKTMKFKQFNTVYACVKLNYLLKNTTMKAKWYDSNGTVILDSPYLIDVNVYEPTYIPFGLQSNEEWLPSGKYKVEIYINDKLSKTENFEVIETELDLSAFENNNIYQNNTYNFSFLIPDEWKYSETDIEKGLQVQIIPPDEKLEIGFLFIAKEDVTDFSKNNLDRIAAEITRPFITEKKPVAVDIDNSEKVSENGIKYYEVIIILEDDAGIQWVIPLCFIGHEDKLFVLYGINNADEYGEDINKIFYGIIDSFEFNKE